MTNAPENFEAFVLPEGVEKFKYAADKKIAHSGTFKLEREDHTLGNLLRMQLIRDPDVVFVGYRHPHPIEHHINIRVQTSSNPKVGSPYEPEDAMRAALNDLSAEFSSLIDGVKKELSTFKRFNTDGPGRH